MHPELLALMQRFELCYLLLDSTPPTWLAPQLLPPGKPAMLTDWARSDGSDLVLRYRYEFLPKGIISRLTVRMHHFVRDPSNAWTTGVLFERDGTFVLVELLPAGDEIELRARGPERKGLLTAIATSLDSLNASFPGLQDKIEKHIRASAAPAAASPPRTFLTRRSCSSAPRSPADGRMPGQLRGMSTWLALLDGVQQTELTRSTRATTVGTAPRRIRMFLASSAELRSDRDEFDRRVRRLNDPHGVRARRLPRGRSLGALPRRDCRQRVCRTSTTQPSARATSSSACSSPRPGNTPRKSSQPRSSISRAAGDRFVYTYFKNAPINTGSLRRADVTSLLQFKSRLSDLGHFPTDYDTVDQLLGMFRDQLDELFDRGL
jgi:hypothetical protein